MYRLSTKGMSGRTSDLSDYGTKGVAEVPEILAPIFRSQEKTLSVLSALATDVKDFSKSQADVLLLLNEVASDLRGVGVKSNRGSQKYPMSPTGGTGELDIMHELSCDPGGEDSVQNVISVSSPRLVAGSERQHGRKVNDQWPASIQIRPFYLAYADDHLDADDLCQMPMLIDSSVSKPAMVKPKALGFALDPNSTPVFILDLACALVLVNDLVVSPYALAWRVDDQSGFVTASTICSCYWLIDFVCNFFVGFYINGELHNRMRSIAMRYFKTWFFLDITVLTVDWSFILMLDGDQGAGKGFGKLLRAFKMVKLLRLLRVMKVSKILGNTTIAMWTLSMNHSVDQVFRVVKILLIILFINHLLSCLWFVIGTDGPTDTGKNWIVQPALDLMSSGFPGHFDFEPSEQDTSSATLLYQYVTTLHQMTAHVCLASCYVYPNSSLEGVVLIILLIYGLLFGGTLVSFFSTTMTQQALNSYERNKQLDALREYIRQRAVRPALALMMYKAARARLDKQTPLTEDDVPAIGLLPHDIHQWVYSETRLQFLMSYSLFYQWNTMNKEPCQLVCEKATRFTFPAGGDVVFVAKEIAKSAYHTLKGRLTYTNRNAGVSNEERGGRTACVIYPGAWISEAALWAQWTHVGKLVASEDSALLVVDALKLPDIVSKDSRIASMTSKYAKEFHKRLIAAEPPHADWPDDIQVPDTDSSDLMSREMCLGLLRRYLKKGALHITDEALIELEDEISSGKCAVQDDKDGNFERVVAVTAVRLERDDGCLFAEIGKWKDECGIADLVQLPGTKRSAGELQNVATRRVLDQTLRHFDGLFSFDRIERACFYKDSKSGLRTKYSRTTYVAKILKANCPDLPEAFDPNDSNPAAYLLPASDYSGKLKIFAWMTPHMMNFFNETAEGADELNEWVSGLLRRGPSEVIF